MMISAVLTSSLRCDIGIVYHTSVWGRCMRLRLGSSDRINVVPWHLPLVFKQPSIDAVGVVAALMCEDTLWCIDPGDFDVLIRHVECSSDARSDAGDQRA